jgi:signal transduction histidine kinase
VAAASSQVARVLLDAALGRAITALAHDLRNALGVVSMQVEVIAIRAASVQPDVPAIAASASVASDHIERLAEMINALIAFARGRASSDLAVIVAESVALVPMRQVQVSVPAAVSVGVDPSLTRAVALEVLVLALATPGVPSLAVTARAGGATLQVVTGAPLVPDAALEWVVQFTKVGGRIDSTEDGVRLQFPPIA